jgi:hypothetical protein
MLCPDWMKEHQFFTQRAWTHFELYRPFNRISTISFAIASGFAEARCPCDHQRRSVMEPGWNISMRKNCGSHQLEHEGSLLEEPRCPGGASSVPPHLAGARRRAARRGRDAGPGPRVVHPSEAATACVKMDGVCPRRRQGRCAGARRAAAGRAPAPLRARRTGSQAHRSAPRRAPFRAWFARRTAPPCGRRRRSPRGTGPARAGTPAASRLRSAGPTPTHPPTRTAAAPARRPRQPRMGARRPGPGGDDAARLGGGAWTRGRLRPVAAGCGRSFGCCALSSVQGMLALVVRAMSCLVPLFSLSSFTLPLSLLPPPPLPLSLSSLAPLAPIAPNW